MSGRRGPGASGAARMGGSSACVRWGGSVDLAFLVRVARGQSGCWRCAPRPSRGGVGSETLQLREGSCAFREGRTEGGEGRKGVVGLRGCRWAFRWTDGRWSFFFLFSIRVSFLAHFGTSDVARPPRAAPGIWHLAFLGVYCGRASATCLLWARGRARCDTLIASAAAASCSSSLASCAPSGGASSAVLVDGGAVLSTYIQILPRLLSCALDRHCSGAHTHSHTHTPHTVFLLFGVRFGYIFGLEWRTRRVARTYNYIRDGMVCFFISLFFLYVCVVFGFVRTSHTLSRVGDGPVSVMHELAR